MKCVNHNHPEFKALEEKLGFPVPVLAAKVGVWMENNNTENFPTATELFKPSPIPDMVDAETSLDNSKVSEAKPKTPTKIIEPSVVQSFALGVEEVEKALLRTKLFRRFNGQIEPHKHKYPEALKVIGSTNAELEYRALRLKKRPYFGGQGREVHYVEILPNPEMFSTSPSKVEEGLENILIEFLSQFGVTFEQWEKVKEHNGYTVYAAADAVRNVIGWAKGYESELTEEAAHIIFELVDNKTKDAILDRVMQTDRFRDFKKENPGLYETDLQYATEVAGQMLAEEFDGPKSILDRLLDKFRKIVAKIFGKGEISDLDAALKKEFGEIADAVRNGDIARFSRENIRGGTYFSAQKRADEIRAMSDQIKVNKEDHTYTFEEQQLQNVTSVADTVPFDNSKLSEEVKQVYEIISGLGTKFHEYAESVINETELDPSFMTPEAKKQADKIVGSLLKRIKRANPGAVILTEVVVANLEANIAGTIDILVIKEDGTMEIYDWKTLSSDPQNYKFSKYKYPRFSRQLGLYKTILETPSPGLNWGGGEVTSINIIPIYVKMTGEKIYKFIPYPKIELQSRAAIDVIEKVFGEVENSSIKKVTASLLDLLEKRISRLAGEKKDFENESELLKELGELEDIKVITRMLASLQVELAEYFKPSKKNLQLKEDLSSDEILELLKLVKMMNQVNTSLATSLEKDSEIYNTFTSLRHYTEIAEKALHSQMQEKAERFLKSVGSNPDTKALFLAVEDITGISLWLGHNATSNNTLIALTDRVIKKINFTIAEQFERDTEALMEAYEDIDSVDFMIDGASYVSEVKREYYDALKEFDERYKEAGLEGNQEAQEKIQKEKSKFIKDNTVKKYTDRYYKMDSLLDSLPEEDLNSWNEARGARVGIKNRNRHISPENWSSEDTDEYNFFSERMAEVRNKHKEVFNKYFNLFNEIFEDDVSEVFERIRKEKKRELSSAEFDAWENAQYTINPPKDYFEWVRNNKEKGLKDPTLNEAEKKLIKELNDKRSKILQTNVDSIGRVNGKSFTPTEVSELRAIEEQFERLKKKLKEEKRGKEYLKSLSEYALMHNFPETIYYKEELAEFKRKLGKNYRETEEFKTWFKENHVENSFTGRFEPIMIWTMPEYTGKGATKTLLPHWNTFKVKDEYLNPDYSEDIYGQPMPNAKWSTEMQKTEEGWTMPGWTKAQSKFYSEFRKLKEKGDEMLPMSNSYRSRNPFSLPNVRKDGKIDLKQVLNVPASETIKNTVEAISKRYTKEDNRGVLLDESGETMKGVPLYYTGDANPDTVDTDIFNTIRAYYKMSLNAHTKLSYKPMIEILRTTLGDSKVSEVGNTGSPLIDTIMSNRRGVDTNKVIDGKSSNVYKKISDNIDSNFYGVEDPDFIIKNVNVNQIVDDVLAYTSIKALGFNLYAGTANVLLGQYLSFQEALGGQFFTYKDWVAAEREYIIDFGRMMSDLVRGTKTSKVNALEAHFKTLQDTDELERKTVSKEKKARWRKLMSTNSLFFINHGGEHKMQNTLLMAAMKAYTIRNGEVERIQEGEKSIYEMVEFKNGKVVSKLTEDQKFDFSNIVKGLSQKLHGVYTKEDRVKAQKEWWGKLLFQFRKWMIPGMRERWGEEYYDERLRDHVGGYYRTSGVFIWSLIKNQDVTLGAIKARMSELKPHQRANLIKFALESSVITLLFVVAGLMHNMRDDDDDLKDSLLFGFSLYNIDRLRSELRFYRSINDFYKIARSPAAAMSTIEDTTKLLAQLLHPGERYESGNYKGKLKLEKYSSDLIPVRNQWNKIVGMDDLIEFYRPFK